MYLYKKSLPLCLCLSLLTVNTQIQPNPLGETNLLHFVQSAILGGLVAKAFDTGVDLMVDGFYKITPTAFIKKDGFLAGIIATSAFIVIKKILNLRRATADRNMALRVAMESIFIDLNNHRGFISNKSSRYFNHCSLNNHHSNHHNPR